MTIAEQLKGLKETLEGWATSNNAFVMVAGDAVELVGILATKPGDVRAVLYFVQEVPRGSYDELGKVERTFHLVLSRGRSFTLQRDGNLTGDASASRPLFDIVEEAREVVRHYTTEATTEDRLVQYLGTRPFNAGGELILDAYQVEFLIVAQIPDSYTVETGSVFPEVAVEEPSES